MEQVTTLDPRKEQLRRDLQTAWRREDLAKHYLEQGWDAKYVALNFGFPLERCLKFLKAHHAKEAAKSERSAATGG